MKSHSAFTCIKTVLSHSSIPYCFVGIHTSFGILQRVELMSMVYYNHPRAQVDHKNYHLGMNLPRLASNC